VSYIYHVNKLAHGTQLVYKNNKSTNQKSKALVSTTCKSSLTTQKGKNIAGADEMFNKCGFGGRLEVVVPKDSIRC